MDEPTTAVDHSKRILKAFNEISTSKVGKMDRGVHKVMFNIFLQEN